MKIISHVALAAVLASGAVGLTLSAPAAAQKKDKKEAGLKLSPDVVKSAQPAQAALQAKDAATAEPLVAAAEAAAKTDDDRYIASVLRLQLAQIKINAAQQANPNTRADSTALVAPLDALIANPKTPPADRARFYYIRGQMAYEGKQYPVAIDYITKARELGHTDPQMTLFLTRAKIDSGDVAGGTAELEKAIAEKTAKGEKAPEDWYRFAIAQSHKKKVKDQTLTWLNKYVAAYPAPKTWYEALTTYGVQQDSVAKLDRQQLIDLFRLMRATGGLNDQYFYLEYAQKAQNAGLPFEAQSVLKEGMANGKIPAANTEAKAMMTEVAQSIRNEGSLSALEAKAKAGPNGSLAMQTGDAYLGSDNFAKAVELYRLALSKGGVDADTVNTRLGIALARMGDKAGAQTAFAAVKSVPRAEIAQFWTTYLTLPGQA
jgi:hypothetical protein